MLMSELKFVYEHDATIIDLIEFFEIRNRKDAHLGFKNVFRSKTKLLKAEQMCFSKLEWKA